MRLASQIDTYLGDSLAKETNDDAASRGARNFDIKIDLVGHLGALLCAA